MKKRFTMTFFLAGAVLIAGSQMVSAQEGNAQAAAPNAPAAANAPYAGGYDAYSADCYGSCDIGCGDVGCGVGYYGNDGCYDACGFGCEGACVPCGGCGLLPFLSEVVSVALTPVHWVAELLSCGTFADCGCAPPCEPCYSDPCDICGNYVGDGGCGSCGESYYGYDGYYSQKQPAKGNYQVAQNNRAPNYSQVRNQRPVNPSLNTQQVNENADYLNYDKIETIGQKKARRNYQQARSMQNQQQARQGYIYEEQIVRQGAPKNVMNGRPNPGRPVQKTAANFNGARNPSVINRAAAAQYGQPLR